MISEVTKTRLATQFRQLKREHSWSFIRQLATAEAAEANPDWDGLRTTLLEMFNQAIDEEFQAGVDRQKGRRTMTPGTPR